MSIAGGIAKLLHGEFGGLDFARREFPMLTVWGVEDFSLTVHSLGCSYLSALGRDHGFWAMSEYPVRVPGSGRTRAVRPDVVWWDREASDVVLLGEYERFEPGKDGVLEEKARNLLEVHRSLGDQPRVLLLMAWAMAGTDRGRPDRVLEIIHSGFRAGGRHVPGLNGSSAFIFATAVFGEADGRCRLLRVCT